MKPKAFILCPSVTDARGFETGARNLFERMQDFEAINFYLVGTSVGNAKGQLNVGSFNRRSAIAGIFSKVFSRNPYIIQNITFFLYLIPYLIWYRPSVLYLADPPLYGYLLRYRKMFGSNYRMVFHTGGNTIPLRTDARDLFQCVTTFSAELALDRKVYAKQIKRLSHYIESATHYSGKIPKSKLRQELGLPADRLIILSVGALDTSVKRMDYVIQEVSRLTVPYYLVILGQRERETPMIEVLTREMLPENSYRIDCVPQRILTDYYRAADLFVLASLGEGFCRASVEAMAQGLPVVMHPFRNAKDIIGDFGYFVDMTQPGNLARKIESLLPFEENQERTSAMMEHVFNLYSWQSLEPVFKDIFMEASQPFISITRE